MSNWGNFSEQAYSDFLQRASSPANFMVVAPALASRAAMAPQSFLMDEDDSEEDEDDWGVGHEDEDHESNARMAMGQLRSMAEDVMLILSHLTPDDDLEPWVAAKITMSKQNLSAVADYLRFSGDYSEEFDFARCQRADGSFYGTRGKCKKGTDAGAKPAPPPKAPRAPKAAKPAKAPKGAKGPKKSMIGPEGYMAATHEERAAALDKEMAKEAKKPKKPISPEQAAVNARAAAMAAEERKKKMTGPEGYMRATDAERAAALEQADRTERTNRVLRGEPERPPVSARQREVNARAAAMAAEERKKKMTGPEGYMAATDKERAAALEQADRTERTNRVLRGEPELPPVSARQREVNARAAEMGFGPAGALRNKYGPKS